MLDEYKGKPTDIEEEDPTVSVDDNDIKKLVDEVLTEIKKEDNEGDKAAQEKKFNDLIKKI